MSDRRPLTYVASEYTHRDPLEVQRHTLVARQIGALVNAAGGLAVIPHQLGIGVEHTLSDEQWYELTRRVMEGCDCVVARAGAMSRGVLEEIRRARELGIPVTDTDDDLRAFLRMAGERGRA